MYVGYSFWRNLTARWEENGPQNIASALNFLFSRNIELDKDRNTVETSFALPVFFIVNLNAVTLSY